MFLTDRKLERRIEELEAYRYRDRFSLECLQVMEDIQGKVNPVLPENFDGWKEMRVGDRWEGRDAYLWLRKKIKVPDAWKGKRITGIFDFGKTGAGNNSGFESMLYVDGEMYQAVDGHHKEVFFDKEFCGKELNLIFRLWSGLEGGGKPKVQEHRISYADLAWLDEKVDDLYYLSSMVWQTIQELKNTDPIQHDLRGALNRAFLCIDWSEPGSDIFYESIHKADGLLNETIDGMDKKSAVTVFCVGHTHIDVAWLWRLKHTREKASRSFTTALRLMEEYPEYVFLQTQPQLYEFMKEEFPSIYQKIKERVKEGRWEADGAMWVEADCNLTSGESLTRQILIGSRFFKEEFGKEPEYLWLPDVFGYSWALPQILKKSGIDTFMTTKISWNQYNRMPHDTFIWKGIDGSEILAHFITTPEPWQKPGSWFYTYNGYILPKTVNGSWNAYSEKAMNKKLLISYGYGDGGGGVNRDMLENRRRLDKIPGMPFVKTSTASEYFKELKETVKNTEEYVNVWDGELYLEYHRGTYTSHAHNKRMNRKMELLYRRTEWLTVMSALAQKNLEQAKQEELTKGWMHILTNQFHDIIPGSSIREVYEDSAKDYRYIESVARGVESDAFRHIIEEKDGYYTVWNASGWSQNGIVAIQSAQDGSYYDTEGKKLKAQREGTITYVEVKDVPPMGNRRIAFEAGTGREEAEDFTVCGRSVETPFYRIAFNEYGQIVDLYDKEYEREILASGARANVFQLFEDKPLDNDAWDIDIFYQEKMREVTELTKFEIIECGALQLKIHMEWKFMHSSIAQDLILYSTSRRIDFYTHVDFHEQHQLLKAAFPIDVRTTYGTYDVQYGNVRRPNHWNTSWDQAKFESVAHRWADLSERNYGVSLLNDCKYGHDIKENVMRITLIKSATHPDYLQDQGMHEFTYALLPHGGDFVDAKTVQEAVMLNDPLYVSNGVCTVSYESFLSFDNDQIELDAVKKSEDGKYIVVRFHDFAGSSQKVTVTPGFTWRSWREGDLRERAIEEAHLDGKITLSLHAYEIKTILILV